MGFDNLPTAESEREERLRAAGEKIQEQLQRCEPIDVADLLSPEEGLIADIGGPLSLRLSDGAIVRLEGENNIGVQFKTKDGVSKNFLNTFDGKLRMCTPEELGNVIDTFITNHPDELPKLQHAVEELEKSSSKLPPMFEYIKSRYGNAKK